MQIHLADAHLVRNHGFVLEMAGVLHSGLGHSTHYSSTASSVVAPVLNINGSEFVVVKDELLEARPRRGHRKLKAVLDGGGKLKDMPEADGVLWVSRDSDQGGPLS